MNNGRNTHQNQQNPPLPKKKRMDSKGNSFVRVIAKDGGSSMILCEHITENGAIALMNSFSESIKRLGGKQTVTFKSIK